MTTLVARILALVVLAGFVGAGAGRADEPVRKGVYAPTLKATLAILTPSGEFSGTAWVVDHKRRLAVTNHHVVEDQASVRAIFPMYQNGKPVGEVTAYHGKPMIVVRVVDSDPKRDLALLQLSAMPDDVAELKLSAEGASPEDRIHSIGNPIKVAQGLWIYSSGSVRMVLNKTIKYDGNQTVSARVVETQAPINPGDSGGPIVNDAGELVAVTSGHHLKGNQVSYGIDVSEVRAFVKEATKWVNASTAAEYKKRGEHYLDTRRFEAATADLTEAMRQGARDVETYALRAGAFNAAGRPDSAIADLVVALRLFPRGASLLRERGLAYLKKFEYEQAIADFSEAIKIDSNHAQTLFRRGLCYKDIGQNEPAAKDFTEAIRLDPKIGPAYIQRGELALAKGDAAAALADFNKAIDNGLGGGYYYRATAHAKKREWDKALKDLEKARELFPRDLDVVVGHGNALRDKGLPEEAVKDYELALELNPRFGPALTGRGILYFRQKKYLPAVNDFNAALVLDPKSDEALLYRARSNFALGRTDEVLRDAESVCRLNPKEATAWNLVSISYYRKGEHAKALENIEQAIKLNGKNSVYYYNRGLAKFGLGKHDEAIADYTKAIEINPKYALAYQWRAKAYDKAGNKEKAEKDREQARKLDPMIR